MSSEELEKFETGLRVVLESNRSARQKMLEEFRAMPVEYHIALQERLSEEAQEARDYAAERTEAYRAGPNTLKERSENKIAEIWKIMQKLKKELPSQSEATRRRAANKRFGTILFERGEQPADRPAYSDDRYLRKKLKEFSVSL